MILNGIELRIDTKVADRLKSTELDAVRRDLTTDEIVCIMAFLNWKAEIEADYDLETIATETNVFSDIHNYAGTADWLVRLTPKPEGDNPLKFAGPTPFVIDFKTSQDIWDLHELQVSSYRVALENGENPLHERNANGTDSNKLVDMAGLRMAILQIGYRRNKAGYKFTEIADRFEDFKVAQHIWRREHTSAKTGDLNTPGFTQRDFPIVLSPARHSAPSKVEEAKPTAPEGGTKTTKKSSRK